MALVGFMTAEYVASVPGAHIALSKTFFLFFQPAPAAAEGQFHGGAGWGGSQAPSCLSFYRSVPVCQAQEADWRVSFLSGLYALHLSFSRILAINSRLASNFSWLWIPQTWVTIILHLVNVLLGEPLSSCCPPQVKCCPHPLWSTCLWGMNLQEGTFLTVEVEREWITWKWTGCSGEITGELLEFLSSGWMTQRFIHTGSPALVGLPSSSRRHLGLDHR